MALFGRKNKKNIELKQDISGYLVFPYPLKHGIVHLGHTAVVPENCVLAFAARGKVLDILPSGTHTLVPTILPKANKKFKLTKLDKNGNAPYGFDGYAYFVNLEPLSNFVFSTYKKLRFNNELDGKFWVRPQFVVDVVVEDAEKLLKNLLSELAILKPNEPEDILESWLSEFVTENLLKSPLRRIDFEKPQVHDLLKLYTLKLKPLLESVGLRLLEMRVLEVEQSGKKTKKGQNPLLINQIDLPKNQEILQEPIKTEDNLQLQSQNSQHINKLEDNCIMDEYNSQQPEETDYGMYEEPDYEAIENRRIELEEEELKKEITSKGSLWSGWESFLEEK